jgi:hypothetical protein
MSATCIDCHYSLDQNTTNDSPTKHDGMLAAYTLDTGYAVIGSGTGTHFLGEVTSSHWNSLNPAFAVTNADWSGDGGKVGARSRFGNTAANPVIICESCHELQPSLNQGALSHLLLSRFYDGQNGDSDGTDDGRDGLCEGCHLPTGTHPMSADIVGRTGVALATDVTNVDWLKTPSDASYGATWVDTNPTLSAAADDDFSCDSCHQVHDANPSSGTYILDAKPASVTLGSTTAGSGTGYAASDFPVRSVNGNVGVAEFCGTCHPYR